MFQRHRSTEISAYCLRHALMYLDTANVFIKANPNVCLKRKEKKEKIHYCSLKILFSIT